MTNNLPSPTRDEENRRLAEWLEPFNTVLTSGLWKWRQWPHEWSNSYSPLTAWWRDVHDGTGAWAEPRNFYADEAANALLLEKMAETANPCVVFETVGEWACDPNGGDGPTSYDKDRKTAIVKATLAYMEAQKS